MHRALRDSAARLATTIGGHAAAGRPVSPSLVRWYRGYADEVLTHHQIEDELLFPALAERIDTYDEYGPTLTADHAELDVLLHGLVAALDDQDLGRAASLAGELRTHLDEHPGYEDEEVVPLFIRHFSPQEFTALNEQATRSTPPRQLLFSAPWLMSMMTADERRNVLAAAPKPVHLLWVLTRGRYRRLTERAFGAGA
ncbi:MAG: hemerythrin domain-containing protein [Acidimicrobiales bacterium]